MRSMMFDVVKLSAQFCGGNIQRLRQLGFQIADLGRIAQAVCKLARQSWSMTVSVPRGALCLANFQSLQNREAVCWERGRPVRRFINNADRIELDASRFMLTAYCLL